MGFGIRVSGCFLQRRFSSVPRIVAWDQTCRKATPGTIEYFLTERYCLYTTNRRGELLRGNIHHMPWPLEKAEADIERNDLPAAHGIRLPDTPPLLHYSRELAVYIWSLELAYALGAGARAPLSAAEPL